MPDINEAYEIRTQHALDRHAIIQGGDLASYDYFADAFTPCPPKVLDVLRQLRAAGIDATWGRWQDSIEIRGDEMAKLLAALRGEKLAPVEDD